MSILSSAIRLRNMHDVIYALDILNMDAADSIGFDSPMNVVVKRNDVGTAAVLGSYGAQLCADSLIYAAFGMSYDTFHWFLFQLGNSQAAVVLESSASVPLRGWRYFWTFFSRKVLVWQFESVTLLLQHILLHERDPFEIFDTHAFGWFCSRVPQVTASELARMWSYDDTEIKIWSSSLSTMQAWELEFEERDQKRSPMTDIDWGSDGYVRKDGLQEVFEDSEDDEEAGK